MVVWAPDSGGGEAAAGSGAGVAISGVEFEPSYRDVSLSSPTQSRVVPTSIVDAVTCKCVKPAVKGALKGLCMHAHRRDKPSIRLKGASQNCENFSYNCVNRMSTIFFSAVQSSESTSVWQASFCSLSCPREFSNVIMTIATKPSKADTDSSLGEFRLCTHSNRHDAGSSLRPNYRVTPRHRFESTPGAPWCLLQSAAACLRAGAPAELR